MNDIADPFILTTVNSGSTDTINLNYSYADTQNTTAFKITVADSNNPSYTRPKVSEINLTGTLLTSQSGPYLAEEITTSENTAYLSNTGFSLEGYIQNVMANGSTINNAYNVTSYWVLSSSFNNLTATNLTFKNLTNNTRQTNAIDINFSNLEGMTSGASHTFYLRAYGYNDSENHNSSTLITTSDNQSLLSDSISITFSCYSTLDGVCVSDCGNDDPDCRGNTVTTTTTTATDTGGSGGGGGGGGGTPSAGRITSGQVTKLLKTTEEFELVRGQSDNFMLTVENPYPGDLTNVTIDIVGFLSQYLVVEPMVKYRINEGDSFNFSIGINAPKYFTRGQYELNFTITGEVLQLGGNEENKWYSSIAMKESRTVTLFIYEVGEKEAKGYLEEILALVTDMDISNLNIKNVDQLYLDAQENIGKKEYEKVKSIYQQIKQDHDNAFSALSIIGEVELLLEKASFEGIELSKTERLLLLTKAAMERADYLTALERANDAKLTYALEKVGKFNLLFFMKNNWLRLLVSVLSISAIAYVVSLFVRLELVTNRIKTLRKEEDVLFSLIKEIQRECFQKGTMTMNEYTDTLLQYEKRMSKVIQEIIKLGTIKINLFRIFSTESKRLNQERTKILSLIKETQSLYLRHGRIETRVYNNRMHTYAERFAEVEERLADIEAKRAMRLQFLHHKKIKAVKQPKPQLPFFENDVMKMVLRQATYVSFVLALATISYISLSLNKGTYVKEMLSPAGIDYGIILLSIGIAIVSVLLGIAARKVFDVAIKKSVDVHDRVKRRKEISAEKKYNKIESEGLKELQKALNKFSVIRNSSNTKEDKKILFDDLKNIYNDIARYTKKK